MRPEGSNAEATPTPWTRAVTLICVLMGAAFGMALIGTTKRLLSDEGAHAGQIRHFWEGHYSVLPMITMIPSYHAVLAAVAKVLPYNDAIHRAVTLVVSLGLPLFAWRLARLYYPREKGRRTLQMFFLPVLFPFFFMIYTDAWCAVAILGTMFFTLRRRFLLAALLALVAVVLRQDSVIWVGLAYLLASVEGIEPRLGAWRAGLRTLLRNSLRHAWPLLVVLLAFVAFVFWNHGVAVGDRTKHQAGAVNVTNAWLLLLWAFVCFLPQNLRSVGRIKRLVWRRPIVVPLCVLAGFGAYLATYSNTHQYNAANMRDWIHNEVLYWMTSRLWIRALAYLPMAWMALTAWATPLPQARLRWLYPVALVSAALHPVIEPRYYIPSLLLFQAWREPVTDRWEDVSLAYEILTSVWLLYVCVVRFTFL